MTTRCIVPAAGGVFPPQDRALGLDGTRHSPLAQEKIVYAAVSFGSYQAASNALNLLCGLAVDPKAVERLTHAIGEERVAQRDAQTAEHRSLPLIERDSRARDDLPCPHVVMVSVDGGRIQIRSDQDQNDATAKTSAASSRSRWRESKTAVLETYAPESHASDPDPDVPRCFLDISRAKEITVGMGHTLPVGLEIPEKPASPLKISCSSQNITNQDDDRCQQSSKSRPGSPKRLVRSILASRDRIDEFGDLMHAEAWKRNFFGAERRVFLGDGAGGNWTIHREHFSTFTPVLDFVHALSYIFSAAFAARSHEEGEAAYREWIQQTWSGEVAKVITSLEARLDELGVPPDDCSENDPRALVQSALRYLRNNADRMKYDEYRRRGMPIMSCAVESAIKMINQRVKGSEKFWSEPGAEAILQLRADHLSETEPLERFWRERRANTTGTRRYRQTG